MKKKIILTGCLLIVTSVIYKNVIKEDALQLVKEKHQKNRKEHLFSKTLQLSKHVRLANGIPPNKYNEEKYLLEMNPYTGRTHPENLDVLQEELTEYLKLKKKTGTPENPWVERDPNNVGGRTRAVIFDPNDLTNKRVIAGGVGGGLWANNDITDATSEWYRILQENIAVSCIAVDPNNPKIMYVGTGELYTQKRAIGNGIWRSLNGGHSWSNVYKIRGATFQITSGTEAFVPGTYYTTDIIIRDKDGNSTTKNDSEVFASITASGYRKEPKKTFLGVGEFGIIKSVDNGVNWNKVVLNNSAGNSEMVIDFETTSDNTLWLSTTINPFGDTGGTIYSSTDGTSFTKKHTIPNARRTELAVSKQNSKTLYVLARLYNTDATSNLIAPFVSILKTADAFATPPTSLSLPDDADNDISANDFTRGQAGYNLTIEVDPSNDKIVYVGGIDLFRSTDSGTTWAQISKWSNNSELSTLNIPLVHADHHGLVFHPTNPNIAVNVTSEKGTESKKIIFQ